MQMFLLFRMSVFLLISFGSTAFAAVQEKPLFKAGAASANITPPLGSSIIGGFRPIPATHIHDDLFARCIVLDDGSTKIVIVIADILGIPREIADSAKRWRLQISLGSLQICKPL